MIWTRLDAGVQRPERECKTRGQRLDCGLQSSDVDVDVDVDADMEMHVRVWY